MTENVDPKSLSLHPKGDQHEPMDAVEAKALEAKNTKGAKTAPEDAKKVAEEKDKAKKEFIEQQKAQNAADGDPDAPVDQVFPDALAQIEPHKVDPVFKSQERSYSEQETESNVRRTKLVNELEEIHAAENDPANGVDLGIIADLNDPNSDLKPLKPKPKDPRRKTQEQTLREQKWEHTDREKRLKDEWNKIVEDRGLEHKPNKTFVQEPRDDKSAKFLAKQNEARKNNESLLPEDSHGKLTAQEPNYIMDDPSLHPTQDYLAQEVTHSNPRVEFTHPVDAPA